MNVNGISGILCKGYLQTRIAILNKFTKFQFLVKTHSKIMKNNCLKVIKRYGKGGVKQ